MGRVRLPVWAWPLLALPVVACVGLWTYRTIATAIQARLEGTLRTMLASNAAALGQWLDGQATLAEVMAADPRVREDVLGLIALVRRTGGDPAALKASPAQARLRAVLTPVVSMEWNEGYLVLDRGGLILSRSVDARIGDRVVLGVADVASHALEGRHAFLAPTLEQRFADAPMAFVLVPLRDASRDVVATFGFRIGSEQMTAILNASRTGESGETYAVDRDGRMVTETRFPEQVTRLGLLSAQFGGRTTARLEVRDPGTLLVEGRPLPSPPKTGARYLSR